MLFPPLADRCYYISFLWCDTRWIIESRSVRLTAEEHLDCPGMQGDSSKLSVPTIPIVRCHMQSNMPDEDEIYDLRDFNSIKEDQEILSRIRLDVTPHMVMEPRFHSRPEDLKKLSEIAGYMFYVEGECEPPALMLMKTGKTDITSTISRVEDIPQEIVSRAVELPVQPPVHGMYAITDEIRDWLKKELGL